MINLKTLKELQEEIGDKKSKLGGGVVSILTASFAASLIEMVCNLTLGKDGYEKVQKYIIKIHRDSLEFKKRLTKLADEDKALSLKISKLLKSNDKDLLKKTIKNAIEVPMEVRKIAQDLEKLGFRVSKIGDKQSVSDSKTAIHLARAASKSALESVKVNKDRLKKA